MTDNGKNPMQQNRRNRGTTKEECRKNHVFFMGEKFMKYSIGFNFKPHIHLNMILLETMIVLVFLLGGCVTSSDIPKNVDASKYIIFEPMSIAYMEYTLQYQDMAGFIDGVTRRCLKENNTLKNYLTRLQQRNNKFKSVPPVFSDSQEWDEFRKLVKTDKCKPYFYIKETIQDAESKHLNLSEITRITGIVLLDVFGKKIKNYVIEKQVFIRENTTMKKTVKTGQQCLERT